MPSRNELEPSQERMLREDAGRAARPQLRLLGVDLPAPRVAVPRGRQHVDRLGVRPGIGHTDRHQQVVRVALRVVDLDDPVAVVVEDAGVEQLVLGIELAATAVLRLELGVRERPLRVVVAPPVPRVARERVEIPPVLLGVLAVVALVAGEAVDALLEDRVAPVPERERQAQALLDVREPGEAVLAPAVGPRAGVVVRQVLPRRAVLAVVLPHRPPLPLREVRAPVVPVARLAQAVLEASEALDPLTLDAHSRSRRRRSRRLRSLMSSVEPTLIPAPGGGGAAASAP